MGKKKETGKSQSVTLRITNSRQVLHCRFYSLIEEHKKAVIQGEPNRKVNKLKRELDDTANLLQAMSSNWDF